MGLLRSNRELFRELSLIKSILRVGLKRSMIDSNLYPLLLSKGYLTKKGFTSAKGKMVIKVL